MGVWNRLQRGVMLYTHGDRGIDMFVVLEGEVDIFLPSADSSLKVYARHRRHNFTGEFKPPDLSGGSGRSTNCVPSTLLRISRTQLQRLMRAEETSRM